MSRVYLRARLARPRARDPLRAHARCRARRAGPCRGGGARRAPGATGATLVLSSPRERALETADPIAAALGRAVEVVPELDEIAFGDWTGRSFADLAGDPLWRRWNEARATARPPGGESMQEAQVRAFELLERLSGTSVLVSHCDVIRAGHCEDSSACPYDAYDRIALDPGSLSLLELWPGGGRLLGLNERPVTA